MLLVVLVGVIAGGGWYLSTQVDHTRLEQLKAMWPFGKKNHVAQPEDTTIEDTVKSLSIEQVIAPEEDASDTNQTDE